MLGNVKFKGVDSSTLGLLINYAGIFIKPALRSSIETVIGKDGGNIFTDKHDVYEIVLACRLKGTVVERRANARLIGAWLQGYGELVLGIEQDVKYEAYAITEISTAVLPIIEDFEMRFLVQPIKTSTLESEVLIWDEADIAWNQADIPWDGYDLSFESITSSDILNVENIGNYISRPVMIISGQATTLNILDDNGVTFTFANLNGTINVDSKNYLVYSGDAPKVNEIQSSNAEFITLNIGANTIEVSGTGFVDLNIEFVNASAYI